MPMREYSKAVKNHTLPADVYSFYRVHDTQLAKDFGPIGGQCLLHGAQYICGCHHTSLYGTAMPSVGARMVVHAKYTLKLVWHSHMF